MICLLNFYRLLITEHLPFALIWMAYKIKEVITIAFCGLFCFQKLVLTSSQVYYCHFIHLACKLIYKCYAN